MEFFFKISKRDFTFIREMRVTSLSELGMLMAPRDFDRSVNLMPITSLWAPSDFQTFLRPYEIKMLLLKRFHPIVKQKSIFFQQLQTMQFVAVIAVLTSTVLQKFEFPLSLFFQVYPLS